MAGSLFQIVMEEDKDSDFKKKTHGKEKNC